MEPRLYCIELKDKDGTDEVWLNYARSCDFCHLPVIKNAPHQGLIGLFGLLRSFLMSVNFTSPIYVEDDSQFLSICTKIKDDNGKLIKHKQESGIASFIFRLLSGSKSIYERYGFIPVDKKTNIPINNYYDLEKLKNEKISFTSSPPKSQTIIGTVINVFNILFPDKKLTDTNVELYRDFSNYLRRNDNTKFLTETIRHTFDKMMCDNYIKYWNTEQYNNQIIDQNSSQIVNKNNNSTINQNNIPIDNQNNTYVNHVDYHAKYLKYKVKYLNLKNK